MGAALCCRADATRFGPRAAATRADEQTASHVTKTVVMEQAPSSAEGVTQDAGLDTGQQMTEQLQACLAQLDQCQQQAQVLTQQQPPRSAGGALGGVLEADLRQAGTLLVRAADTLRALGATEHVRIAGAVTADGSSPKASVNGDYARTGRMANGRAVYRKVGDAERGLWYDAADGRWICGFWSDVGTPIGYAELTTAADSPERAAGAVWGVLPGPGTVPKDGEFVEQAGVAATAVTEAEVEAEKQRVEEDCCARDAAMADAAAYVRIAGAVEKDGSTPKAIVNGDYAKTGDVANGRAVYVKVGDAARGMW